MPDRLKPWAGLLAAVLCLGEQARILRPSDRAVLKPGPVAVIARAPSQDELRLDGVPLPLTRPAPDVLTATITPAPGPHKLTLGEGTVEFFIAGPKAKTPAGWKAYRPHPPAAATCETCHAVKDGAWGFRRATLSDSCFQCHQQKTFASTHSHNETVLAECQLCHDPHGSTAQFHLKMPRETACKQCHG